MEGVRGMREMMNREIWDQDLARRNIGWLKREINIVDDESSPSTNSFILQEFASFAVFLFFLLDIFGHCSIDTIG